MGNLKWLVLSILLLLGNTTSKACSGYKITAGNRTFFGSNEDAWRLTPHLWFETAKPGTKYGAAFTGSRWDAPNGYAPQAGMNQAGIVYERLASYWPGARPKVSAHLKKITNPTQYLKDILHQCGTLEQVRDYINAHDHSFFMEDVFVYADQSGRYLVVEPFSTTMGGDAAYIFSNFCPSVTAAETANELDRYRNGKLFVSKGVEASLDYARKLSDTMHVCRRKIGDGTLLTSIWDLSALKVNVYFYHNYKQTLQFDLNRELALGDHSISLTERFHSNAEFNRLREYKTPLNNMPLAVLVVGSGGFFLCSVVVFPVGYWRRKRNTPYAWLPWVLAVLAILCCFFMFVLIANQGIYYFSAPYVAPGDVLISASSYTPYLMLAFLPALLLINVRLWQKRDWHWTLRSWLTLHNLIYVLLVAAFCYWRFYG